MGVICLDMEICLRHLQALTRDLGVCIHLILNFSAGNEGHISRHGDLPSPPTGRQLHIDIFSPYNFGVSCYCHSEPRTTHT